MDMLSLLDPSAMLGMVQLMTAGQDPDALVASATDAILDTVAQAHTRAGTLAPEGVMFFHTNHAGRAALTGAPVAMDEFVQGAVVAALVGVGLVQLDQLRNLPMGTLYTAERLGAVTP